MRFFTKAMDIDSMCQINKLKSKVHVYGTDCRYRKFCHRRYFADLIIGASLFTIFCYTYMYVRMLSVYSGVSII